MFPNDTFKHLPPAAERKARRLQNLFQYDVTHSFASTCSHIEEQTNFLLTMLYPGSARHSSRLGRPDETGDPLESVHGVAKEIEILLDLVKENDFHKNISPPPPPPQMSVRNQILVDGTQARSTGTIIPPSLATGFIHSALVPVREFQT